MTSPVSDQWIHVSEKVERTDDMPVSIFKPEEKYDEKHKSVQYGVFYSAEVAVPLGWLSKGEALFTLELTTISWLSCIWLPSRPWVLNILFSVTFWIQGSIGKSRRHDHSLLRVFERYSAQCRSLGEQRQPEHRSSEEGNLVRPERQGMVTYNQNIAKTSWLPCIYLPKRPWALNRLFYVTYRMQGSIRKSLRHDQSLLRVFERYSAQYRSLKENSYNWAQKLWGSHRRQSWETWNERGRIEAENAERSARWTLPKSGRCWRRMGKGQMSKIPPRIIS